MNGRVFAVNRSPVLAWNIEPQLQVPYPDMPAAAAISPMVPAASDPYGRCWQNQVDAGTNFPYFGALYNNGLPPTAYRLQPGCMPNLGQFWPPTPPPDGCGRFDGSNLYFGHPVLRHTENISSNLRNSYQGLGHYSHLVETPKEQNHRVIKREKANSPNVSAPNMTMCSSASKPDGISNCCTVDSKLKSPASMAYSLPKQELHTVSSGHGPYLCSPDIRSSSSMHPSTDKSCYSPSHSLKNTLSFHNSSQDNGLRAKSFLGNQENCNASPLKNVYFSHYESENINSVHTKSFEKLNDRQLEHKNSLPLSGSKSKHLSQPPSSYHHTSFSSRKYDFPIGQELHNGLGSCNPGSRDKSCDGIVFLKEQQQHKQKSSSHKIKPEKTSHSDCKFMQSVSRNTAFVQGPEYKNSDMFNIPTSVLHPKIEPSDKYFLSTCSSTAPSCMATSYATSGPFLMTKDLSSDLRTNVGYQNSIYQNSCPLGKPWHYNELPSISLDNYFRSPEAAKPPSQNPPHVSPSLHEGLISVAQTAPQDMDLMRMAGTLQSNLQPANFPKKSCKVSESDDEVQIIGVQTNNSSAKYESRHSSERKQNVQIPVSIPEPPCSKNEQEPELKKQKLSEYTSENNFSINNQPPKIYLNNERSKPTCKEPISELNKQNSAFEDNSNLKVDRTSPLLCEVTTIKQELLNEPESSSVENLETSMKTAQLSDIGYKFVDQDSKVNLFPTGGEKIVIKEEAFVEDEKMDYNENHGLNLLMNTIEKITSFQKVDFEKSGSSEVSLKMDESTEKSKTFDKLSSIRGLELLSAIAGQRLASDFDFVKSEVDEAGIKCNYPEIKENKLVSEEDQAKQTLESFANTSKTSVFEIQNRLAELKKKYKQKQKELSRLKPKRRFANAYLKGCQKTVKEDSEGSTFSNTSSCSANDNLIGSISSVSSDQDVRSLKEGALELKIKSENMDDSLENPIKRSNRLSAVKRESPAQLLEKRVTRKGLEKSKSISKVLKISKESKPIKKSTSGKAFKLRKSQESPDNLCHIFPSSNSKLTTFEKESLKKSTSLPENTKNSKVYALRHSSQHLNKYAESLVENAALSCQVISSKRKSDNPKKYVPSKQSKLSETIIAKHLRSRILFDTSGSTSDDEKNVKDGVPDDLYDALMKCHLGEETKTGSTLSAEGSFGYPEPNRLCAKHLVERQRLLALEDGLFYAGCIKECQASKKYGIVLDGQRGNRLHMFTREELLTQTIVESKPLSSELPEGTRVCAYWSQQYRCLYPGVVGQAPCPSADWSEPRVFVLFDDGDSGQIPTKNIRLIPKDIIPIESTCRREPVNGLSSRSNSKNRSSQSRKPKCSTTKCLNSKCRDTGVENESKESSCASINESSCDDSCFVDSLSPSHTQEDPTSTENRTSGLAHCSLDGDKSGKRQRKRSKRRTSHRTKSGLVDSVKTKDKCEAKLKRHKKYKDKHRRHHHHHHRHHHHHHHHHHSKKHKHRRKNAKSTSPQDLDYENCIPCNSDLNSPKDIATEISADLTQHSSTVNLPQSEQNRVC